MVFLLAMIYRLVSMKHTFSMWSGLLSLMVLSQSCGWSDPVRVERDFGHSVRQMVELQKAQPVSPVHESTSETGEYVGGIDGESVANSLETYRGRQKNTPERSAPGLIRLDN